ncbi:carotenoid 9,10(9',10')-cleavage dioxygenase-like [Malus domestica]|uniref:carotenoid 9,10(9',10')-cleavage dioxygenase-like n=1 Tax=Malus domestica TaxID=3750 RepID=UPI003975BE5B
MHTMFLNILLDVLVLICRLLEYNHEGYARISAMPHYGNADSIHWFKVEPNCTFHIINSFEDGDEVVVWGCKALDSIIPGPDMASTQFGCGEVNEIYLTGKRFCMDFSMINGAFSGVKNRYGYAQVIDSVVSSASGMLKYNGLAKLHFEEPADVSLSSEGQLEEAIKVETHMFEENSFCTGACFVPKQGGF